MCLASEWIQPIVYTREEKTADFFLCAPPPAISVDVCRGAHVPAGPRSHQLCLYLLPPALTSPPAPVLLPPAELLEVMVYFYLHVYNNSRGVRSGGTMRPVCLWWSGVTGPWRQITSQDISSNTTNGDRGDGSVSAAR